MIIWYNHPTDATLLEVTVTETQATITDLFDRRVYISDPSIRNPAILLSRFREIWPGVQITLRCPQHSYPGDLINHDTVPHAWAPLIQALRPQLHDIPHLDTIPESWQPLIHAIRKQLREFTPFTFRATCTQCNAMCSVETTLDASRMPIVRPE